MSNAVEQFENQEKIGKQLLRTRAVPGSESYSLSGRPLSPGRFFSLQSYSNN
ncbi:MAG TPA: hypothetical protein VFW00_08325 [Rhodocyclaceae bacterium]|nr:hypothetical protein [Rhodocyclaceae bacterium]